MEGPRVKIEMATEREIIVSKNGREIPKRVPTRTIEAGATLFYTIDLVNEGDSVATNVVVNNPIPKGSTYVLGSAAGKGSKPMISLDNGSSFKPETNMPGILPESVTDVRWLVDNMPAGSKRKLEFQVTAIANETAALARLWSGIYLWLLTTFSR